MKRIPDRVQAASLYEVFARADAYCQAVRIRTGERPVGSEGLNCVDAYVLRLLSAWHPRIEQIFDAAGDATSGASTAFWSAQGDGPAVHFAAEAGASWVRELTGFLNESGNDEPHWISPNAIVERIRNSESVPLICLGDDAAGDLVACADQIHEAHPSAIISVFPVGPIGADAKLEELLSWARNREMRFTLVRELDPALVRSGTLILSPLQDLDTPAALARIRRLFAGNFDFLALARLQFTLGQEVGKLRADLQRVTGERDENWRHCLDERRERHENMQYFLVEREHLQHSAHLKWKEAHDAYLQALRIPTGTRWALACKLQRLRLTFAPHGSLQERLGQMLMRSQRSIRRGLRGRR